MKKYILLENDTMEFFGRELFRIQAVKNFSDVKAGRFRRIYRKRSELGSQRWCLDIRQC